MKLLFCIHTPKSENTAVYGGYQTKKRFCEAQGWRADILTPHDFPHANLTGRRVYLFYSINAFLYLLKQKETYDLIIFHSYAGWVFNLFKFFVPRFHRIKVITAFHGLEPLFIHEMTQEYELAGKPLRWYFKFFHKRFLNLLIWISCRFSDGIFCLNNRERKYLIDHHYQNAAKIHLVSNEISEAEMLPRQYLPKAKRLLFLGQWLITKGTTYLIKAFEQLVKEDPELHLRITGAFKDPMEVKKDLPASLLNHVSIYPQVPHGNIWETFKDADLFIFPSVSEGFSRALIEAMATGLPVISTRAGSAGDFLEHKQNGWIIPFRDSNAIVEAVQALKQDFSLREKMGKAGQQKVHELFSTQKVLKNWSELCLTIFQK